MQIEIRMLVGMVPALLVLVPVVEKRGLEWGGLVLVLVLVLRLGMGLGLLVPLVEEESLMSRYVPNPLLRKLFGQWRY